MFIGIECSNKLCTCQLLPKYNKTYPTATIHGYCVWIRNMTTQEIDIHCTIICPKSQKSCPKIQYVSNKWFNLLITWVMQSMHPWLENRHDYSVRNYPPVGKLMHPHYTDISAGYMNIDQDSVNNMLIFYKLLTKSNQTRRFYGRAVGFRNKKN